MGKKKKKKKKKRAGGPPPAVPGKAWEKAATALAAAASQPGVHAAIDDVDTLMHLASLRKAEAELSRAQHDLPDAYATHAAAHALSLPIGRAQAPPPTSLTANAATSTVGGAAAVSIYSDYDGDWQSICGLQIHATISLVESAQTSVVEALYFNRFPEVKKLIDNPASEQEKRIGAAFSKSKFYSVSPSFIRFTNNGDSFAGRTEWHL